MIKKHFNCLESMYQAAPINAFYKPKMIVSKGQATIEIELSEKFHHAAGAVHGSVYFKCWMMLPFLQLTH
jgi:acyl-coenzyme A thioesterase PaaI-like protein